MGGGGSVPLMAKFGTKETPVVKIGHDRRLACHVLFKIYSHSTIKRSTTYMDERMLSKHLFSLQTEMQPYLTPRIKFQIIIASRVEPSKCIDRQEI